MTRRLSKSLVAQSIAVALAIIAIAVAPFLIEIFTLMQFTLFAAMAILSLSLAFIWGFGGILCFGQTSFFGLGAYAYAIAAINFQNSTPGLFFAIAVPSFFALILGYFVFYGRISDVYLGVITLTVTLILFNIVNSTSGEQYRIGTALIGGFNGIPAVPTLNWFGAGAQPLTLEQSWWVTGGALVAIYLGMRALLASSFGRVVVAVRENETRASLLGYDPRAIKLVTFVIGGAVAGLAGAFYVNWGAFVSPTIFSLSLSAEIIIWITVGGMGTLLGPVVGSILIEYLISKIGSQQALNSNLVLGAILVGFVLLLPKGIVPAVRDLGCGLGARLKKDKAEPEAMSVQPAGAE
ncbi:UNVERIFIED_ORG: amino acid/amide ABC transporter membrane protein 2 (HAAT family) [Martelella mediterranea]